MPRGNKDIKIAGEGHRWKKGESGNPRGRPPREACITSLLVELLDKNAEGLSDEMLKKIGLKAGDKRTWRQLVAKAILCGAAMGKPGLVQELLDRLEGKVAQTTELAGIRGQPLEVEIDAKGKLISAINRLSARMGEAGSTGEADPTGS